MPLPATLRFRQLAPATSNCLEKDLLADGGRSAVFLRGLVRCGREERSKLVEDGVRRRWLADDGARCRAYGAGRGRRNHVPRAVRHIGLDRCGRSRNHVVVAVLHAAVPGRDSLGRPRAAQGQRAHVGHRHRRHRRGKGNHDRENRYGSAHGMLPPTPRRTPTRVARDQNGFKSSAGYFDVGGPPSSSPVAWPILPGEAHNCRPRPLMRTIHIPFDTKLLRAADRAARKTKRSRSALVRDALREYLRELEIQAREERDRHGYAMRPQVAAETVALEDEAAWPD